MERRRIYSDVHFQAEDFPKVNWQTYILKIDAMAEQGSYIGNALAGDAAPHASDEESQLGVLTGKLGEALHCFSHLLKATCAWNSIAASLQTLGLAVHGSKVV